MTRPEPVQITYGGRAYNASYRLKDGVISIESAYGSRSAEIGRSEPENKAAELLREVVHAWRPAGQPATPEAHQGPERTVAGARAKRLPSRSKA